MKNNTSASIAILFRQSFKMCGFFFISVIATMPLAHSQQTCMEENGGISTIFETGHIKTIFHSDGTQSTVFDNEACKTAFHLKRKQSTKLDNGITKTNIQPVNNNQSKTNSKVKKVKFISTPKGTYYPPSKLPIEKQKLKGFNWMPEKRPEKE